MSRALSKPGLAAAAVCRNAVLCAITVCLTLSQNGCTKRQPIQEIEIRDQGPVKFGQPEKIAAFQSRQINESSGLAISWNHAGCMWTHNDNGSKAGLFLVGKSGEVLAHVKLDGVPFRDWEDIASFQFANQNWLALADVGDNGRRHESGRIYLFKEPFVEAVESRSDPAELSVSEVINIEFVYPEGPRDCEAMAVDVVSEQIVLISKRNPAFVRSEKSESTTIHMVPLQFTPTSEPIDAIRVKSGFNLTMITGMDISPDGRLAVARSYTGAWLFRRSKVAVARSLSEPIASTYLPLQKQGEAICFSQDGNSVIISSEGIGQMLWRIPLER